MINDQPLTKMVEEWFCSFIDYLFSHLIVSALKQCGLYVVCPLESTDRLIKFIINLLNHNSGDKTNLRDSFLKCLCWKMNISWY